MKVFPFICHHIPTGRNFHKVAHALDELTFLRALAKWNACTIPIYHYYPNPCTSPEYPVMTTDVQNQEN